MWEHGNKSPGIRRRHRHGVSSEEDIVRAQVHLNKYNAAIAGATNWVKSEAVLAGPWISHPPPLPMRRKKAVEYLGGIVGHDRAMVLKKWADIEEKMDRRIRQ